MKKTKIISIIAQKGGVGKTTTAFNLACALQKKGYEVLVVDLDAQCNLTYTCGTMPKLTICNVIFSNIMQNEVDFADVIQHANCGIDYIASSKMLNTVNSQIAADSESPYVLKRIFENDVFKKYDYIIYDNKTALDILAQNALNTSDYAIIPLESGQYAFDGLDDLLNKLKSLNATTNHNLKLLGILYNKAEENSNVGKAISSATKHIYGNQVFRTVIPLRKAKTEEAITMQTGCVNIKGNSLAEIYENFADEVIERSER